MQTRSKLSDKGGVLDGDISCILFLEILKSRQYHFQRIDDREREGARLPWTSHPAMILRVFLSLMVCELSDTSFKIFYKT